MNSRVVAETVNLIANPGFETCRLGVDDGIKPLHLKMMDPSHWWRHHADVNRTAHYIWDQSAARTGTFGVSIDTRLQDAAVPFFEAWSSYVSASELTNATVKLRINAKLQADDQNGAIELRIHAFNEIDAADGICGAAVRLADGDSRWAEGEMTFTVPTGATHLLIQLGITGCGLASFDDVKLIIDDTNPVPAETWTASSDDPRYIPARPTAGVVINTLTPPEAALEPKAWNILLYAAADFLDAYSPAVDFAYAIQSNEQINVLIFEDPFNSEASIFTSTCASFPVELTPVLELGEPDVADAATLQSFLEYASEWFPAERTVLYLYGHGHGCWGACYDDTNGTMGAVGRDWLSPIDLQKALESVGGIDAVMFAAPCATSSLEAAYQVRAVTDLFAAAEEMSGYWYWKDAIEPFTKTLAENPSIGPEAMGVAILGEIESVVQPMIDNKIAYVDHQPAIAATITDRLPQLGRALETFTIALIDALSDHRDAVETARSNSENFLFGEFVDVYDFAENCQTIPGLFESANLVMNTLNAAVVAQTINLVAHPDGHGLSVYFPKLTSEAPRVYDAFSFTHSGDRYRDYGLSLLDDTRWYEFLDKFFSE